MTQNRRKVQGEWQDGGREGGHGLTGCIRDFREVSLALREANLRDECDGKNELRNRESFVDVHGRF